MRRSLLVTASATITVIAGSVLGPGPAVAVPSAPAPSDGTARYIVVLDDSADAAAVSTRQADRLGVEVDHVFSAALEGYSARLTTSEAQELRTLPNVASVHRDTLVTIDAQNMPTGINRADADLSPTAKIDGLDERVDVDVAVIDTGADLDHPDLNIYQAGATNCSPLAPSPEDGNGHGTHVSGTIGALDNGDGVVGVAPGARIWPVKVLSDAGVGFESDVVCGIDYVAAHAAEIEVANMSLGGVGSDDGNCGRTDGDAMHEAICTATAAGVTFVVAAGNGSADAATSTPAAYDEVITVSALADFNGVPGGGAAATCRADEDDAFASFSNYGADIDLIAPGVCIESTWMNGEYNTISGTSMASPHVAGGAALYQATHPAATPDEVKAALQAAGTTDWTTTGDPDGITEKLLNTSTF